MKKLIALLGLVPMVALAQLPPKTTSWSRQFLTNTAAAGGRTALGVVVTNPVYDATQFGYDASQGLSIKTGPVITNAFLTNSSYAHSLTATGATRIGSGSIFTNPVLNGATITGAVTVGTANVTNANLATIGYAGPDTESKVIYVSTNMAVTGTLSVTALTLRSGTMDYLESLTDSQTGYRTWDKNAIDHGQGWELTNLTDNSILRLGARLPGDRVDLTADLNTGWTNKVSGNFSGATNLPVGFTNSALVSQAGKWIWLASHGFPNWTDPLYPDIQAVGGERGRTNMSGIYLLTSDTGTNGWTLASSNWVYCDPNYYTNQCGPYASDAAAMYYKGRFFVCYNFDPYDANTWAPENGLMAQGIGVAQSSDLTNWSRVGVFYPMGTANTNAAMGAPTWYQENGSNFLVGVWGQYGGINSDKKRIFITQALDDTFTNWSTATVLLESNVAGGIQFDAFITKIGTKYWMNYLNGANTPSMATNSDLVSAFTSTTDWNLPTESPPPVGCAECVAYNGMKRINVSGNRWVAFTQMTGTNTAFFSESLDNCATWQPWQPMACPHEVWMPWGIVYMTESATNKVWTMGGLDYGEVAVKAPLLTARNAKFGNLEVEGGTIGDSAYFEGQVSASKFQANESGQFVGHNFTPWRTAFYPSSQATNFIVDFQKGSYYLQATNNICLASSTNRTPGVVRTTKIIVDPFSRAAGSEPTLRLNGSWVTNKALKIDWAISNITEITLTCWGLQETNVVVSCEPLTPASYIGSELDIQTVNVTNLVIQQNVGYLSNADITNKLAVPLGKTNYMLVNTNGPMVSIWSDGWSVYAKQLAP